MRDAVRRHRLTAQLRGEAKVQTAARDALAALGRIALRQLQASGMDPAVLDRHAWQTILDDTLTPVIRDVYAAAFKTQAVTAAAVPSPEPSVTVTANTAADAYMTRVRNRLVSVSDTVYGQIVDTLREGREASVTRPDGTVDVGESIPQLAARVESLLTDAQTWAGRAQTIARTEVVGANNAGHRAAARFNASVLDVPDERVAKEWLATEDDSTRETHAEADGQIVMGLDTPFQVGDSELQQPGDEAGDPGEVINCRCTVLFHYPGDNDYPDPGSVAASASLYRRPPSALHTERRRQETPMTLTARTAAADNAAQDEETSVVVVALPSDADPCRQIGGEDKHATLLYLGGIPGSGDDTENPGLTADFQTALTGIVTDAAAATAPFTEDVTGVESLGDDGARVWMLTGDSLSALRDLLTVGPVPDMLGAVKQFPSYTPHVTIDYPADAPADARQEEDDDAPDAEDTPGAPVDTTLLDPAVEEAAAAVTSIAFDRLAVWWAGEQTIYDLTSNVTVTAAAGDPAPVQQMDAGEPAPAVSPEMEDAAESDQFYGVAVVEDSQTGDCRVFGPGSLFWDEPSLPVPLGWQVQDAPGHDGSVVCGRIDAYMRFGNLIGYTGTWDVEGAGWETRRLVAGKFLRGISVDTDDIDVTVVTPDGEVVDPMAMMFGDGDDAILLIEKARIRSQTMCRVPAFTEAFIANGTPPDGWAGEQPGAALPAEQAPSETPPPPPAPEAVTAALVAAAERADLPALELPSLSDFTNPGLTQPTRLTVTDDGRVFGHLAVWSICHMGVQGECLTAETLVSDTNYAYFTRGKVETDQGLVAVGPLTMGTGHASLSPHLSANRVIDHYDNTGTAVADVAVGNDEHGIWMAGRIRPGVSAEQVYALRATGSVSGDWRPIGTCSELVAALVVNVPGFPIPDMQLSQMDGNVALVASGVLRPGTDVPTQAFPADHGAIPLAALAGALKQLRRRDAAAARLIGRRRGRAAARLTDREQTRRVTAAAARLTRKD